MKTFEYSGVVTAVRSKYADIKLCAGAKVVVALSRGGRKLTPGEDVKVLIEENVFRRMIISVFLPVFFTILVFGVFYNGTKDEILLGFMAMVVLGPYMSFIWILKDSLSRTIKIEGS